MTLKKLRETVDAIKWEDSDDMPISVVGNLGTLRKLLAVVEAAKLCACDFPPEDEADNLTTPCCQIRRTLEALEAE